MLSIPACWAATVLLELPWFLWGFSRLPVRKRCALALGANLVSYPWVSIIFPALFSDYDSYLATAETFAPLVEVGWCAWTLGHCTRRETLAVVLANLTSWLLGSWLRDVLLTQ
jgi:hypothetical protein